MPRKNIVITDAATNCGQCFHRTAGDGSWSELVRCALHTPPPPPEPVKRLYRVRWTEEYCQDREAESAEAALEERDDHDSFQGCVESSAELVCMKCRGTGKAERGASCGVCNDGVIPEAA